MVPPAGPMESTCAAAVTSSNGGGTVTVSWALPVLPSTVAVIVAAPAATAVTLPNDETVATAVALLAQVTTRPDRAAPLALRGVATSRRTSPTASDGVIGATSTLATAVGGGGFVAPPSPPPLHPVLPTTHTATKPNPRRA